MSTSDVAQWAPERAADRAAAPAATPAVVLAGYYPPPFGGESVHVSSLVHCLRDAGFRVEVLNLRRGAPPSPEYRTTSVPFDLLRALAACLDRGTVLHLHTNGHSARSWGVVLLAACAVRARRATGILTLHSGMAPDYLAGLGAAGRAAARVAAGAFAEIVCVNERIREALSALGVDAARLSVIPAYLGLDDPAPLSAEDRERVAGCAPLVVTAGGPDPEYGLPVLVQALPALRSGFPRLGCVVVGSGGNEDLTRLVDRLGLRDCVHCVGEVARERYLALLARADVFVRPTYADGDALSVREALALGVPVLASDTDCRPPGVTLFRRGAAADLAAKLSSMLAGSARGAPRSAAAPPAAAAKLLALYARLGRSGPSRRGSA
ncbi:MAG: glycosyltransferase [Candidatus Rokubacteria bacterium]|nr:glycosyltransferase [Candidatus Rokubacteria bacterium]